MKNTLSDKRVMIIAPNNCSPDYRITKSREMIKKITPNVSLVRMVDVNKELHEIEMAHDIKAHSYGTCLEILSEQKFFSHIGFIIYFLLKTNSLLERFTRTLTNTLTITRTLTNTLTNTLTKMKKNCINLLPFKSYRSYENKIKRKVKKFKSMLADS